MYIHFQSRYIFLVVTKRLVDIDDDLLDAARGWLGTTTIKDTVGQALRLAVADREEGLERALDVLIEVPLVDRSEAWR